MHTCTCMYMNTNGFHNLKSIKVIVTNLDNRNKSNTIQRKIIRIQQPNKCIRNAKKIKDRIHNQEKNQYMQTHMADFEDGRQDW